MDVMTRNCCRHMRNLFIARFKKETGEDWKDCPEQGEAFIKGVGKKAYQKATKPQKRKIELGDVNEWNLLTLSRVLHNFGDPKTHEKENKAVKDLAGLSEFRPKQKLNLEEFSQKVRVYQRCVKLLQEIDEGLESKPAEVVSEKAGEPKGDDMEGDLYFNLTKLIARSEFEPGCTQTEEAFHQERHMLQGMVIDGQELVLRGHQYFMGWGVEQNDNEAYRLYTLAAKMGNCEAIYNLAHCYFNGRGVSQDLVKAFKLYLEVANLPPTSPGKLTPAQKNFGVAEAQNAVGLLHEMGVVVKQNYHQAIMFYKKGADNGSGNATNNLAILFHKGLGVPKNVRTAEYYWHRGVDLQSPNAAASLVSHLIRHLEPKDALSYYHIGKNLGHKGLLEISEEQFGALLSEVKAQRDEKLSGLLEFESKHNLQQSGFTLLQRLQRQTNGENPALVKLFEDLDKYCSQNGCPVEYKTCEEKVDVDLLKVKAMEGSITAVRVLDTLTTVIQIINFINEKSEDDLNPSEKMLIVGLFYKITILGPHVFNIPPKIMEKIHLTVNQLYEEQCENNSTEASEADMMIRFCYVSSLPLNYADGEDLSEEIDKIKIGIKLYPDNLYYYDLISYLYRMNNAIKSSLHYDEKGLQKFPNNLNLLYSRAYLLRLDFEYQLDPDGKKIREVVDAYLKYLSEAPEQNQTVPEAWYALSALHFNIMEIEYYYGMGQEAEKKILPCYLPINPTLKHASQLNMLMNCDAKAANSLAIREKQEVKVKSVLESKPYLNNPCRKELVMNHRQAICDMREVNQGRDWNVQLGAAQLPKLTQKMGKRGRRPHRSITVAEMNSNAKEDHIFKERVIHLAIIEDPNLSFVAINVVAEDVNGDVIRVFLYNTEKSKKEIDKLEFGSLIAIANPYFIVSGKGGFSKHLRNDDPECFAYLGKKNKMCRFCGAENASFNCSKCKRASYCTKECQVLDSKLKHKLICFVE